MRKWQGKGFREVIPTVPRIGGIHINSLFLLFLSQLKRKQDLLFLFSNSLCLLFFFFQMLCSA